MLTDERSRHDSTSADGRTMGTDRGPVCPTQTDGTTATRSAKDHGWYSVDPEDRFSLARLAGLLGLMADDVGLVQPLESGRNVGQNPRTSASETTTRSGVVVRGRDHCPSGAMCLGGRGKNDPNEPEDHALGRSRGGISSKIHILCDGQGHPLGVVATAGQVHVSFRPNPPAINYNCPSPKRSKRRNCDCGHRSLVQQ